MKKLLVLMLILSFALFISCSKKETELTGKEWKAKIIKVAGKVQVIKDGNIQPAKLNMILSQNDVIKSDYGTADLKIANLGLIKVKSYTTVELTSISKDTKFNLKSGKILLALNKLRRKNTLNVETPTAVAGVRGTSFLITSYGKNSKIGVLTGKVEVRTFNGFVTVNEFKEVRISGKELKKVSNMNIATIIDAKSILKIKNIDSIDGYMKIKANVKKLEIIEASERTEGVDVDSLKRAIKAREMEEEGAAITEELRKKSADVKSSSIDSSKKRFIEDKDF